MYPNFVLLLLLNTDQEILLLRRINTPFCNEHYALPGGQIKPGEHARQAAVREARDSLGIVIAQNDLTFLHVMHRKCNEPEFFACVFTASAWQGTISNHEPERHDDLRWCAYEALPTNIVPAHQHALEQLQLGRRYSEHGWH